jgi:predicted esterase
MPDLGFIHRFVPAPDPATAPTLLLLHGTGGDENDLLSLGSELGPEANLLSPRGKVLESGMPRFFRRLAEGVFDLEDLRVRTHELADFVVAAVQTYGFDPSRITSVGFSNGANIAASVFLLRPETLAGGILFRAMVPLEPDSPPNLTGRSVLMCEGQHDPIVPRENAERLAELLRGAGAEVTLAWQAGGHGLTREDIRIAKEWLTRMTG